MMRRSLLALGALAILALGDVATASAQPRGGRGPGGFGGPGIGRGFGGPGFGGPGFGGPGFGGPGVGIGYRGNNWGIYYNTGPGFYGRGYAPYGYYGSNYYSSPSYYYSTPSYYETLPSSQYVVPASATASSYGMQITQVFDGPAKKANLRSGDIILSVGNTRVQSFEALQAALAGNREVEISFLNSASKNVEKKTVKVDDNRIGVEVVAVPMP